MDTWLLAHATGVRLGVFFGVFVLMAAWEIVAPRRALREFKSIRWISNLLIEPFRDRTGAYAINRRQEAR